MRLNFLRWSNFHIFRIYFQSLFFFPKRIFSFSSVWKILRWLAEKHNLTFVAFSSALFVLSSKLLPFSFNDRLPRRANLRGDFLRGSVYRVLRKCGGTPGHVSRITIVTISRHEIRHYFFQITRWQSALRDRGSYRCPK